MSFGYFLCAPFLFNTKKCGWETLADSVKNDVIRFSDEYIHFLNRIAIIYYTFNAFN